MDIQELKNFVNSMPISPEAKEGFINDLENNVSPETIIKKIEELLVAQQREALEKDPEFAKEYAEAQKEYEGEVEKAYGEFNAKMTEIEKEAASVDREVAKQIDNIHAEELKAEIKN